MPQQALHDPKALKDFTLPVALRYMSLLALALTGCTLTSTAPPTPTTGAAIQGRVHGGQQPVSGAQVYLYAANTTGYGGNGIAASTANASISLLTSSVLANNPLRSGIDTSGHYYVTTDATGSFSITGDYNCTPGQQVYLYAVGGNPGSGTNSAAGFLAILGNCPTAGNFAAATPYIWMNEVSTVAAAYAFAGFATDATHVSSSGTTLAQTGIANAFLNATNLANLSTGTALAITPAGNGGVPQATINTLANILASCINSTGPISSTCSTLFTNAESAGASGTKATDTATAAINIAHNPGTSIANLYGLQTGIASPFSPALTIQPNDFTVGLNFNGTALNTIRSIAIDASGNVWTANGGDPTDGDGTDTISELSSLGSVISDYTCGQDPQSVAIDLSGNVWTANLPTGQNNQYSSICEFPSNRYASSVYTGGGLNGPNSIAFDALDNAWIANPNGFDVSKFSSVGKPISASGYTGGGLNEPQSVAIDPSGNAWVANTGGRAGVSISKFFSSGIAASSSGYTGGGLFGPASIAIDASGNAWTANCGNNGTISSSSLSKFSSSGAPISPSSGYTGGGLSCPASIAIDGAGNSWIGNLGNDSISAFSNGGSPISPSSGYTGGGLSQPVSVAIDGSGNVWIGLASSMSVFELIGTAIPVVTPIVANLISPYSAAASKP